MTKASPDTQAGPSGTIDSAVPRPFPDDYGIHAYADTIFATDELIGAQPDLVRRFLRATLRGWTDAIENPTAVGAMVARYKLDADAALGLDVRLACPLQARAASRGASDA